MQTQPNRQFADKVVIVTGAGRGIGYAIAERFAQQGAKTVIAEIDAETMFKLKDIVIYVLGGTALLKMNSLAGPLAAHQYQYIPATVRFQIGNAGYEPLVYLSFTVTDPFTEHGTELVKTAETQTQDSAHEQSYK